MKDKVYYRRNLPHIQPQGELFFVTWRLKGAIPKKKRLLLEEEFIVRKAKITDQNLLDRENRLYFKKYDELLHNEKSGKHYLKNQELAQIVADSIHFWDTKNMELIAYCIMSNHVHLVLQMFYENEEGKELYLRNILGSIKQYSARRCNKIIGNTGNDFWQHESYDRVIRNKEELNRILIYTLNNPVQAGLCQNRKDWQFSYIKEQYNGFM